MTALRKSLQRGSAWVNHAISFRARARESMLMADTDWTDWSRSKELHHQILGLPDQARAFLEPILAGVSIGLTALTEAAGRGQIEIGADKLLHLPPIRRLKLFYGGDNYSDAGGLMACSAEHVVNAPLPR